MTGIEHYPDVFNDINIPPINRAIALKAKGLLDLATGQPSDWESFDVNTSLHTAENAGVQQAFWETHHTFEGSALDSDRLVLTLTQQSLTIALEHRRRDKKNPTPRATLLLSEFKAPVLFTSTYVHARMGETLNNQRDITAFRNRFYKTTAALGLYRRVAMGQNEQPFDQQEFAEAA